MKITEFLADSHVGTIMYLAYGQGPHIDEAVFSLLTASRFVPFNEDVIRYLVYTDQPQMFSKLHGVEVVMVDQERLDEWMAGTGYIHRRKTMAMLDALERVKGKLVFIDSDTCFQASPLRLFDKVGPGRTCLHVMENRLRYTNDSDIQKIWDAVVKHDFRWKNGSIADLSGNTEMWNSGVTGIDYSDISVLFESLDLSDKLWTLTQANTCEQFAMGSAARKFTQVSTAWDIVFHYWPGFLKGPFRQSLASNLTKVLSLPASNRGEAAYVMRIKATKLQWLKQRTKFAIRSIGIPLRGFLRSA